MDSGIRDSSAVLTKGNAAQFAFLLDLYPQALQLKSESKKKKPEELKKFDDWYHNELPKKIQQRCAKEGNGYLIHEELIQTIKWKLARGKWRPRLKELITMNTPRVVQLETKKAIRQLMKKDDLTSAILAMSNLKGVGPAMASAVLSATMPESVPYMSDECMLSMPGMEDRSIEYTVAEYLKMVEHVRRASKRLSAAGHSEWTPHKVEQVVFSHHVIVHNKPELLENMPMYTANGDAENGSSNDVVNADPDNGEPEKSNGQSVTEEVAIGDATAVTAGGEDSRDTTSVVSVSDSVGSESVLGGVAACLTDDATNDSVVSIAGSSSCPTLNEDSNLTLDGSPTTKLNTDSVATTNGNVAEDNTDEPAKSDVIPENDDVTRAKRGADESVEATPTKCAKTEEIVAE